MENGSGSGHKDGVEVKVDMLLEEVRELRKTMSMNYVPRNEIDERFKAQGERIGTIEAALTKINHIIWVLVIGGVFAVVFGVTK